MPDPNGAVRRVRSAGRMLPPQGATATWSSSAFKQHQAARPRTEPRLRCRRNKRSAPNEEEARRRVRPRKLARIGQVHNGRDGPQHRQARCRMAWPARLRLATRPVARQNRSGFSSEVYRAVTVLYLSQVVDPCQPPCHDQETVAMSVRARTVHVPYTIEQDEDGVWCASAQLRPGVGGGRRR